MDKSDEFKRYAAKRDAAEAWMDKRERAFAVMRPTDRKEYCDGIAMVKRFPNMTAVAAYDMDMDSFKMFAECLVGGRRVRTLGIIDNPRRPSIYATYKGNIEQFFYEHVAKCKSDLIEAVMRGVRE